MTAMSVFNNSWQGLATQRGLESATEKITGAVDKGTQRIADAVAKIKNARRKRYDPVDNSFYIPADYREKLAEQARLALASIPSDYIASASSITEAVKRETFKNYLERLVASTQPEDTLPDEESEVVDKQQSGRAVTYIQVADDEGTVPSGGDPVNDITLAAEDDTGENPLFDGYAANGRMVFNTASTAPPIVGSFNELF
jgi:uncharacterized protein YdbL (DUF1318 family)